MVKPLSDGDVVKAMSYIAGQVVSEASMEGQGITCPELQAFMKKVRRVKGEFTDALLNKMFYACTPKHVLTVDDALGALQSADYGHGWTHILSLALLAASKAETATQLPSLSPRRTGSNSGRTTTYISPRKGAINAIIDAAQSTRRRERTASLAEPEDAFPHWSVHHGDDYRDSFDKLRVNRNGMSLHEARDIDSHAQRSAMKKIRPNEYGAVVVPNSPRNDGYAVVVVDATAERERMRRAVHRQAELKKLLAQGGSMVEKYLNNELSLPESSEGPIRPRDLGYQRTMTAIVDFLASPRKPGDS